MRLLRLILKLQRKTVPPYESENNNMYADNTQINDTIHCDLKQNISVFKQTFDSCSDFVIREINLGPSGEMKAAIAYMQVLIDTDRIDKMLENLILQAGSILPNAAAFFQQEDSSNSTDFLPPLCDIEYISDFPLICQSILSGQTAIMLDGQNQCLIIRTRRLEDRGVQESSTQSVVRGPKDGFTETLTTNISLIRRRIKDSNLKLEMKNIGRVTKTDVAIMYIQGIADHKVVDEVRWRLDRIDIDGILESGYIEELIQDATFTPFPTIYNTERPDSAAAGLLEGRISILVDGTPFVLLVPVLFTQFLQAPEDYYHRFDFGLIRMVRFFAFSIAMLAPAIYIAMSTFHQSFIPSQLLISLAAQREGIPFPAFVEALIMEITFELLREAGIRMPRTTGQAISIVGALVLGQSAVEAGLVSPAMVIIVSITAISSFIIPSYSMGFGVRILRFGFMGLAATFGIYGIMLGIFMMVLHLCSLRSFGIPYMSPWGPYNFSNLKDTILRLPWKSMRTRPKLLNPNNNLRESNPAAQSGKNEKNTQ